MSACVAPASRPDPFRKEQHLTRNLGSSSWDTGAPLPPGNRMWVVIQLTQEEDQAITNLLKLHHGEGKSTVELVVDNEHCHDLDHSSDQKNEHSSNSAHSSQTTQSTLRKDWSDEELEVANTLLTLFGATGESKGVKLCCGNLRHSSDSDLPVHERMLSTSERDALDGLLNLGLAQA